MFDSRYPVMHNGVHTHIDDFGGGGAPLKTIKIDLHAVPRVEGDVGFTIEVENNQLKKVLVGPHEPPRFIEHVLRGHHYNEAPIIASKICGICWAPHFLASVQAVEKALEITPTLQTRTLREILLLATILQSNIQHSVLLSLPDLLRLPNAFPLVESIPEVFAIVRKLERLGNDITQALSGRDVGGIAFTVGGMLTVPEEKKIEELIRRVEDAKREIFTLAGVFKTHLTPEKTLAFSREREFISLTPSKDDTGYIYTGGMYCSSDTGSVPITIENYLAHTNERYPDGSTGKFTRHVRNSVTVGSLARFVNNYEHLCSEAKTAARIFGLERRDFRIAMNPVAQVVEAVDAIYRLEKELKKILLLGIKKETIPKMVNLGENLREGVGIVEAPRGLLIHHYTLRGEKIEKANCIVPTGQNYGSMQDDIEFILPTYLKEGLDDAEIQFRAEKIIRDHDPCSSCAVHFLRKK